MTERSLSQAQDHDRRIGRMEGIAEQLPHRLYAIERAVAELRTRMDSQFRWLVGIQITSLTTLGSLLFSIISKLPS